MNTEYGREDAKPDWKDWLFENWDLIGLLTICAVTVLIGAWAGVNTGVLK